MKEKDRTQTDTQTTGRQTSRKEDKQGGRQTNRDRQTGSESVDWCMST